MTDTEKLEQKLAESEKALCREQQIPDFFTTQREEEVASLRAELASAKEDHEKPVILGILDGELDNPEELRVALIESESKLGMSRHENKRLNAQLDEAHSRIKTQGRLHTVDRAALLRSKSKVMKENTGLRAQNSRLNAAVIRQALELTDEKEAGEHRAAELQTLHRDHEEILGRENGSPDRD